jgi:Holliday junction resolvase-like predicted endonuclease
MTTSPPSDADIDTAAEYFQRQLGCEVLDRRWRAPDGSGVAHIIAAAGQHVLHIGVIRQSAPGSRRYLSETKVRQFRHVALAWMQAHGTRYDQIKIEVVTIAREVTDEAEVS